MNYEDKFKFNQNNNDRREFGNGLFNESAELRIAREQFANAQKNITNIQQQFTETQSKAKKARERLLALQAEIEMAEVALQWSQTEADMKELEVNMELGRLAEFEARQIEEESRIAKEKIEELEIQALAKKDDSDSLLQEMHRNHLMQVEEMVSSFVDKERTRQTGMNLTSQQYKPSIEKIEESFDDFDIELLQTKIQKTNSVAFNQESPSNNQKPFNQNNNSDDFESEKETEEFEEEQYEKSSSDIHSLKEAELMEKIRQIQKQIEDNENIVKQQQQVNEEINRKLEIISESTKDIDLSLD